MSRRKFNLSIYLKTFFVCLRNGHETKKIMASVYFEDYNSLMDAKSYLEAQYDYNLNGAWNVGSNSHGNFRIDVDLERLDNIRSGLASKFTTDCRKKEGKIQY